MKYTQSDEQSFIEQKFSGQTKGKFLDIGSFHVFTFSNVRWLYEQGFKGVMVEPSKSNYQAIADHYAEDKDMVVLNVAIGEENGEITFYDCGDDAIGTTEVGHRDRWAAAGVKYETTTVRQVSVIDFFNEYGKDVDMISLDTESTNINIFRLIPDWVFNRLKLLVIEHDGNQEEIEERLSPFGFEVVYQNAENLLLVKK